MIYLVGGVPRIGKTRLVSEVVRRQPMHAISTDAIRYMLRRALPREVLSQELVLDKRAEGSLLAGKLEQVLTNQNAESKALWPYLEQLMRSYTEDDIDLLVEGVAVIPELVRSIKLPYRVIFIGNSSASHTETLVKHALQNRHDWLHGRSPEEVSAYADFFAYMSDWLKAEATAHAMPYTAVHDETFTDDIAAAAQRLLA